MAGGKGTRLSAVTHDLIPKPMTPFDGEPMICRIVRILAREGITEIILCVGHLGEQIEEYFRECLIPDVRIRIFLEREPLGSGGALKEIRDWISDDFIFLYADLIFDVDLERMVCFHRERYAEATLFVHPNNHPYDSDLVLLDDGDRVTGFHYRGEHSGNEDNLVNAGLCILSPAALDSLPSAGKISFEKDFLDNLIRKGKRVFGYRSTEYIRDVGTPERLASAEEDWKAGIITARNLRHPQKAIFLDRDGTINEFRGLVTKPEQIALIPGAGEAIRRINASEYLAIVATNQPVIARGDCTVGDLRRIHQRLTELLGREGAWIDDLIYCPHHPDRGFPGEVKELKIDCECRKPKPGMILKMAEKHHIDLAASWMIGDQEKDVEAGHRAGTRAMLLDQNNQKTTSQADLICRDLSEGVDQILNLHKRKCAEFHPVIVFNS